MRASRLFLQATLGGPIYLFIAVVQGRVVTHHEPIFIVGDFTVRLDHPIPPKPAR